MVGAWAAWVAANYRDVNMLLPDVHWGLCRCALLVLFFLRSYSFPAFVRHSFAFFLCIRTLPHSCCYFSSSFCAYLKGGFDGYSFLYDARCSVVLALLSIAAASSSSSSSLLVLLSLPFLLVHLFLLFFC